MAEQSIGSADLVDLTVRRGVVEVRPADAPQAPPTRVTVGEELVHVAGDTGSILKVVEADQAFAWTGRPLIYRDTLLGPAYAGNAFICEPVHNLVHREVLSSDGVTFAGHRAAEERTSEFLASTDNWFRPVQVRTGPDGALWVVDMYRYVIEHPRWISPERLAELDVRGGADKGLIYRVFRASDPPRAVVLWGGERIFAAGADVGEFGGPEEAAEIGARFHDTLAALAAIPRVTIAAIAGYALGGGCELALACDFRVCADTAKLGQHTRRVLGVVQHHLHDGQVEHGVRKWQSIHVGETHRAMRQAGSGQP